MLCVIGCGNLNRSDDGVGVVVARELMKFVSEREACSAVKVFDAGTGGMDVMFRARGASRLVLIDASRSGSSPGAIFQVPGEELARAYQPALSLHNFRWDHALYAGRRIFGNDFPTAVTVFLIEAATLELGTDLSEPVQRAAMQVIADITTLIEQHVAAPPQSAEDRRSTPTASASHARIARGSIYLDAATCAEYFGRASSVAALTLDGRSLLMPLHGSSAGGLLLKVRNAHGDRVVHAEEFLRTLGIESGSPEQRVPIRWCAHAAGLILEGLVSTANQVSTPKI